MEIAIEVDDAETIVRAIKTPHHINKRKGTLRPAAFLPRGGESRISVMRQLMGDDFCKSKGVEICGSEYMGLAVISAGTIRTIGSSVVDAREEWLGHAHVDHGLTNLRKPELNEPHDPELTERCKQLAEASVFHVDQAPAEPGWAGPPLKL
jgi:hypothetical protein